MIRMVNCRHQPTVKYAENLKKKNAVAVIHAVRYRNVD